MADIAIFRINYKSDFILTLNSDAGWMTPFCIKFWTGAPSQAYFVGYDGTTYTHCAPVDGEPTKLLVQFDDHHLPIGDLKFQIGYHFTVADFPTSVEDEVINQASVIIEVDDAPAQVMLDLNGETAPEIEFSLPAYANEAQRIANEEQRIEAEQQRIANEEARIAAETIRQQNEAQRISNEESRVAEFARLKRESEAATDDANAAATLANEKAALADDKAVLADAAAILANQKAQLAADKAALAQAAATIANEKAAFAQQKAAYALTQGDYAKEQGDYAKEQGDYAKAQGDTAQADHVRAEEDHTTAAADHTTAASDHIRAEGDHTTAASDHSRAESDHTTASSDHSRAEGDHTTASSDHTRAEGDHTTAASDHETAASDHTRAESDHAAVEVYVDSLGAFNISAYHATDGVLAKYADLAAALGTNGANIPDALRKGGMSVKFVQSSDNKYVQFRLMTTEFSTTESDWQGVDNVPTTGSKNLVESGGVAEQINEMWYEKQDISSINIKNNYGILISGTYIGTTFYNTNYVSTDYIDVSNANEGYIKVTTITNPSALGVGLVFYNESKEPLAGYNFSGEKSNQLHEIATPQGAKYIKTTLWKDTTYGELEILFLKERQSLPDKFNDTNKELEDIIAVNVHQQQQIEDLKGQIMNLDKTSVISVDLMQFCHGLNRLSSLDYMSVVSSTSDSITLSSSNAEAFSDNSYYGQSVAVGFSDGSYKMVFFSNRSGNTIPRASFDDTDLTNAQKVQSLHDTLSKGQHLSPSGYLAMANFVATEIGKRTSLIDKNWLGGIIFNEMKNTTGWQNTNANNWIYDADNNVVCKPIFYNWLWGGYTPNGNNTSNGRGISSMSIFCYGSNGWTDKCYHFIQGKKDAYIEFPITLKCTGFVEVQAAKLAEKSTSTGDCKMSIYADDTLVGENTLLKSQTRYIFENVTVKKELRVRFTLLGDVDTDIVIYSIGMWQMYPNVNIPSLNGSTIAVLGDSWTQFPGSSTALSDHEEYNVNVVRPDGTIGDGCGYFPKELARLTGSTVDNWGKSNMRADNWGLEKIDTILNYKSYDFLIIEFFINDLNAGIPKETWASNIKSICRKCQRKGTRPVFIMPCGTNSINQTAELGKWHEYVLKGLDVN